MNVVARIVITDKSRPCLQAEAQKQNAFNPFLLCGGISSSSRHLRTLIHSAYASSSSSSSSIYHLRHKSFHVVAEEEKNQEMATVVGNDCKLGCPESFPPLNLADCRNAAAKRSFSSRCISLPARTHPLDAYLADDLHSLRSWLSSSSSSCSNAHSISNGLTRLHRLLADLPGILQLPRAQDHLRRSPVLADRLLDDFLRLADAHGSFRSASLGLQQLLAATQVALRHLEEPRLASCLRAQRDAGKQLSKLAATVREIKKQPQPAGFTAEETEVAKVMLEVVASVAEASTTVFLGVAEISAAAMDATTTPSRFSWASAVLRWRERATSRLLYNKASREVNMGGGKWRKERSATKFNGTASSMEDSRPSTPFRWEAAALRWKARATSESLSKKSSMGAIGGDAEAEEKRKATLEKLRRAEDAIRSLENGGELVIRSLVNVRVTFLNILTPGI
ncbi:hypothetical protein Cni_G18489 [Canna indica]|uniref:Uncharacterized protein n=1 Tax=Canna indica TaxID=4628 RepID=A0AAQ3QHM1_9LILI|nr:hypothetical protein Cni_G18489 [Canna indica]